MSIIDEVKDYFRYNRYNDEAESYTKSNNITNNFDTGIQNKNAFFHAYLSANIAYDNNQYISRLLGNIREINSFAKNTADFLTGNISSNEFVKDLRYSMRDSFNNEIGIQIAQFAKSVNLPKSTIADLERDAIQNGRLIADEL